MIIGCQIHSYLIFSSGPIWEPTTHLRSDRQHVQEHDDWQRKSMCHYKVCGARMIHAACFNMDWMFFLWLTIFEPKPSFTCRPHLQIKPLEKKYQGIHMTRFWFNIQINLFLYTFSVLRKQSDLSLSNSSRWKLYNPLHFQAISAVLQRSTFQYLSFADIIFYFLRSHCHCWQALPLYFTPTIVFAAVVTILGIVSFLIYTGSGEKLANVVS